MSTKMSCVFRPFLLSASVAGLFFATTVARADAPSAGDEALFRRLDADGNGTIAATEVATDQKRLFARLVRKADANGDKSLSREEFLAALVPSRPEKKIEAKQPEGYPQADAVRYLLLTMDTSGDSWINADEVPDDMRSVYEMMAERIDLNKNGTMDRYELSRNPRELGQVAARFVMREKIDVAKELKKFDKSQGQAAKRFDEPPGAFMSNLKNPRQARVIFTQFDSNSDGQLVLSEFPEQLQKQLERFMRFADRDRDGGLSEREFLAAAERMNRVLQGKRPKSDREADSQAERKARSKAQSMPPKALPAKAIPPESMPAEAMSAEEK